MERSLASIQKVVELFPIPGADNIEGCRVLGWELVVKKGEFKPGDLGVFFEVDSILPPKEEFYFMEPRRYRVKTIKLRKQIAQGLLMPISSIKFVDLSSFKEGDDVTELLGVNKHEPGDPDTGESSTKVFLGGTKGKFPYFLRKTDEIRIQSMPSVLTRYNGKKFYVTEKVDGCSATYFVKTTRIGDEFLHNLKKKAHTTLSVLFYKFMRLLLSFLGVFFTYKRFGVCSRNLEIKEQNINNFWLIAKELDLCNKMKQIPFDLCVQGELLGPGIQKNKYNLSNYQFKLFNAFNIETQKYLSYKETVDIARTLGLDMVPILDEITLNHSVADLVELSKGKSKLNSSTTREGIVCRAIVDGDEEGRVSFKVINPEFLLKFDE
jgi:RNA ligase (TIGR02306 family)